MALLPNKTKKPLKKASIQRCASTVEKPRLVESVTAANTDPDDYEDDDDDDIPFQELIWLQIDANLKVRNS